MRVAIPVTVPALVAPLAASPAGVAGAKDAVLDRTLACATSVQDGVRKLDVHVQAGVRDGTRAWEWLPSPRVRTTAGRALLYGDVRDSGSARLLMNGRWVT